MLLLLQSIGVRSVQECLCCYGTEECTFRYTSVAIGDRSVRSGTLTFLWLFSASLVRQLDKASAKRLNGIFINCN